MIIEAAERFIKRGETQWNGETIYSWIGIKRIREGLKRRDRTDLWRHLLHAYQRYRNDHITVTVEIDSVGFFRVEKKSLPNYHLAPGRPDDAAA
jgi:hypothetical protein